MSATDPVQAALMAAATAHRPTSGMQVSSGVTCVCGYWTGSEPQGPIPGGWNQLLPHMMREAATAARPAIERGAKAEAWDEGFDAGHQAARAVNPEWPERPTNPYRIEREGQA